THHHPTPNNRNAILLCGFGKSLGRRIHQGSLNRIFQLNYKVKYFPKLLDNPSVPPEDKQKIRELLKKPWNLYIRRHTGLTAASRMIREQPLKQYAGWTPNSQMHIRNIHYFNDEGNNQVLQEYGILPKDKQSVDILKVKNCPNCDSI